MDSVEERNRYIPLLEQFVTPPRLQHSIGVMNAMGELAEIYALDRSRALTAGLVHDVAKDLTPEHLLELAAEAQINFAHPCEQHPTYLHATVGAYLASKELGITDTLILNAIAAHSDGGSKDDPNILFSRCLQWADILAPVKEWNGMKKLKSVVYAKRVEEAELLRWGWLIEFFNEMKIPIHPNLTQGFQALSTKLGVGNDFFERW